MRHFASAHDPGTRPAAPALWEPRVSKVLHPAALRQMECRLHFRHGNTFTGSLESKSADPVGRKAAGWQPHQQRIPLRNSC
ncbi:Protein of unknown function [Gryllus bimaculatus]|nr:Protein of unknown function [Gryllus bimaculatus]